MLTTCLTEKFHKEDDCVILLGGFDGLHVGHRHLMERAKTFNLPIGVMTIVGGKTGNSIFTLAEREDIFRRCGADFAFSFCFSEIKDLSAVEFLRKLQDEFSVKAFICGDDFRFGKGAQGTAETLKEYAQVCVEVEEIVQIGGEKVGATAIKKLLLEGDVVAANALLGEPFFLSGKVFKDRQVGRTMGFPTANVIYPAEKYSLKEGVYESQVEIDGKTYKGITNYGSRPTFDDGLVLTETYLDGFEGNLYDKKITIQFIRFLRDVKKFESAEKLRAQLTEDIRRVREND